MQRVLHLSVISRPNLVNLQYMYVRNVTIAIIVNKLVSSLTTKSARPLNKLTLKLILLSRQPQTVPCLPIPSPNTRPNAWL